MKKLYHKQPEKEEVVCDDNIREFKKVKEEGIKVLKEKKWTVTLSGIMLMIFQRDIPSMKGAS